MHTMNYNACISVTLQQSAININKYNKSTAIVSITITAMIVGIVSIILSVTDDASAEPRNSLSDIAVVLLYPT